MKYAHKLLSCLLAVLMLFGCFPAAAVQASDALFDIAGANMTLGNELVLNFMVESSKLNATKSYTAMITHGGSTMQVPLVKYNSRYYCAPYGAAAKEMADEISIEIADETGRIVSNPYHRSIQGYAQSMLGNTSVANNTELKTLLVDMLNYGTEAQKYFNYNTGSYANAQLTEEQRALASAPVICENTQVKGKNFVGSNLSLEDSILLNMFFSGITNKNVKGMTATVEFEDYQGKFVSTQAEVTAYGSSMCKIAVDEVVLADAQQNVTVKVYAADGTLHGEGTDSVESYIARTTGGETDALNETIMKFSAAAYYYLTDATAPEPEEPEDPETPDLPVDSTISGVLTNPETREPLANAQVQVYNSENALIDTVSTIEDGSFTIKAEPGTYLLKISANGFDLCEVSCTVSKGASTDVVPSLTPAATGTLEGIVTDEYTGEVFHSITLEVYNADGRWVEDLTVNEKGIFRTELKPGVYTLKTAIDCGALPYETTCIVESGQTTYADMVLTEAYFSVGMDCFGRPGIEWYTHHDRQWNLLWFEPYDPDFSSYNVDCGESFASMDEMWIAGVRPEHPTDGSLVDFLYGYHRGHYGFILTVDGKMSDYADLQDLVDDVDKVAGKGVLVEAYVLTDAIYVVVINTYIGKVIDVNTARGTVTLGGDNKIITTDNEWNFDASDVQNETVVLFRQCEQHRIHDAEVIEPITAIVTDAAVDGMGNYSFTASGKTYEYGATFGLYLGGYYFGDYDHFDIDLRPHHIYTDKNGYVLWTEWVDTAAWQIVVIDEDAVVSDGRYMTPDGENYKTNTCNFIYFEEDAPIRTVNTTYDFNRDLLGLSDSGEDILAIVEPYKDDIYMVQANKLTGNYAGEIYLKKGATKIGSNDSSHEVTDYLITDDTQIIVRIPNYTKEGGYTYKYFDGKDELDANYVAESFQYMLDNEWYEDGSGRSYSHIYITSTYTMESNRALLLKKIASNGILSKYEAIVDGELGVIVYEDAYNTADKILAATERPVLMVSRMKKTGYTMNGLPVWTEVRKESPLSYSEDADFLLTGGVLSWNDGTTTTVDWNGLMMEDDADIWIIVPDDRGVYEAEKITQEEFNFYRAEYGWKQSAGYCWAMDVNDASGRTNGLYDTLCIVLEPGDRMGGIAGIVADENGSPIFGAEVEIYDEGGTLTTDAAAGLQGEYAFALPEGSYTICFTAEGYSSTETTVDVTARTVCKADAQLTRLTDGFLPHTEIVVIDGDSWVSDDYNSSTDTFLTNTCDFVYFEDGAPIRTVNTTSEFNLEMVTPHETDKDFLALIEYPDESNIYMARASELANVSNEFIYLRKGSVKIGSSDGSHKVTDYLVNKDTQIIVRVRDYFAENADDFIYLYFDGIDTIDAQYKAEEFQYILDNEWGQQGSGRYYSHIYIDAVYAKQTNRAFLLRYAGSKLEGLENGYLMGGNLYEAIVNGEPGYVVYEDSFVSDILAANGRPTLIVSELVLVNYTIDGMPVWVEEKKEAPISYSRDADFMLSDGVLSWNDGTSTTVDWNGLTMDKDGMVWIAALNKRGEYEAKLISQDEFNDYRTEYGWNQVAGYCWVMDVNDESGRTDGLYDYLFIVIDPAV